MFGPNVLGSLGDDAQNKHILFFKERTSENRSTFLKRTLKETLKLVFLCHRLICQDIIYLLKRMQTTV